MRRREVLKVTIKDGKDENEKIFKTNIKISKVKEPQKFVGKPGKNKLKKVGRNARRLIRQIYKKCRPDQILVAPNTICIKCRSSNPDPQLETNVLKAFQTAFRKKIDKIEISDPDATLPGSLLRSLNLE